VADAIEANYNAWMAREKARMDKDVAQAEAAGAADEAARRQRAKDSQANMNATNRAMLQAKAEARAQARAADAGYADEWSQRVRELKQEVRHCRGRDGRGGELKQEVRHCRGREGREGREGIGSVGRMRADCWG
jgi:hypothetical protein